jgi:hypothetical protein
MADDTPPPAPPVPLIERVTSFHNQRPRFMTSVGLSIQPYRDIVSAANEIADGLYDVDTALGQQLDFTGQWIGPSRWITTEVPVWFSLDTPDLGFDQGKWKMPYETSEQLVELDDYNYRLLLYARIIANYWDGTVEGAYAAWDELLGPSGYKILIQDGGPHGPNCNGNMNILIALLGPPLNAVKLAMLQGGYLGLKSAGVGTGYVIQNQGPAKGLGIPLFGFDCGPDQPPAFYPPTPIAGFDMSAWASSDLAVGEPAATYWDAGLTIWDGGASGWDGQSP